MHHTATQLRWLAPNAVSAGAQGNVKLNPSDECRQYSGHLLTLCCFLAGWLWGPARYPANTGQGMVPTGAAQHSSPADLGLYLYLLHRSNVIKLPSICSTYHR